MSFSLRMRISLPVAQTLPYATQNSVRPTTLNAFLPTYSRKLV